RCGQGGPCPQRLGQPADGLPTCPQPLLLFRFAVSRPRKHNPKHLTSAHPSGDSCQRMIYERSVSDVLTATVDHVHGGGQVHVHVNDQGGVNVNDHVEVNVDVGNFRLRTLG